MDSLHIAFLLFAGIAGGAISTLAGGAAIITFPALLATGISPVLASCSNLVGAGPRQSSLRLLRPQAIAAARALVRRHGGGVGRRRARRRDAADVHARARVRRAHSAAARICHRAVRLCRAHQRLAARARRGEGPRRAQLGHHRRLAVAGVGLWRLFRRRARRARARRDLGRDRRRLSLRQCHQESRRRHQQRRGGGVLRVERHRGVAAGAGDDGGRAARRAARLADRARAAERRRALAAGHRSARR